MINRPFWQQRMESSWARAPIVWLSGVRRSGKTTLIRQGFADASVRYVNCDDPRTGEISRFPMDFLRGVGERVLAFDEIHRLPDPSRVLKLAADEFPSLRVLATGSSTLGAARTFSDALTGRKRAVPLTPVLWSELPAFRVGVEDRLLRGGLPPALLARERDAGFYAEWMDSYFSRDIAHLFGVRDAARFTQLLHLLLRQNGGLVEIASLARDSGLSRPTVMSHLRAMEITHALHLLPPYHGGGATELVRAPKAYAFDTGFVCHSRGWDSLRPSDRGHLWENLVLDELLAHHPRDRLFHWRDKQRHEVDFVLSRGREAVDAIECEWDPDAFDPRSLKAFRALHPRGRNWLITPNAVTVARRRIGDLVLEVGPPGILSAAETTAR